MCPRPHRHRWHLSRPAPRPTPYRPSCVCVQAIYIQRSYRRLADDRRASVRLGDIKQRAAIEKLRTEHGHASRRLEELRIRTAARKAQASGTREMLFELKAVQHKVCAPHLAALAARRPARCSRHHTRPRSA